MGLLNMMFKDQSFVGPTGKSWYLQPIQGEGWCKDQGFKSRAKAFSGGAAKMIFSGL
jgi:hypothetical protein